MEKKVVFLKNQNTLMGSFAFNRMSNMSHRWPPYVVCLTSTPTFWCLMTGGGGIFVGGVYFLEKS